MPSILSIVTPAAATALTDLASVKLELGITGSAEDVYLQGQIAQASAAISSWCSRVFGQETVRETWRPGGGEANLTLARFPVTSIASVIEDGVTLAAADYEMEAAGMLWRLDADERIAWRASKITVQYTAGYLLPDQTSRNLPHDVQRACILMVAAQYGARGRDPMLRSESSQGIGATSYLDPRAGMEAMPPQVAGLLTPYRSVTA